RRRNTPAAPDSQAGSLARRPGTPARSKRYWISRGARPQSRAMAIEILGAAEVAAMRRAGRAAAATLAMVGARLSPDISTADIDAWVRADTARRGGRPSQLGVHGVPAAGGTR